MSTKPRVITTISGTGPVMALDLNTVPAEIMLAIVQAALCVSAHWDDANISTPESEGAEDALINLSKTVSALDDLLIPVIPGAPVVKLGDIMCTDSYPVIRGGEVREVKPEDLTPMELQVVHHWLKFHASTAENHAGMIQERMEKLAQVSA